jgi:hypothetical protein
MTVRNIKATKKKRKALPTSVKNLVSKFDNLVIQSPKRNSHSLSGWDGFFPYYAGYPEAFAHPLSRSVKERVREITPNYDLVAVSTPGYSHSFISRQTKYLNIQHKEFFVAHQTVEPARLKNAAFEIVGNFPAH